MMTRFLVLAGLLLVCGCPGAPPTGGATADAGAFAACLERPSELPRPPTGGLPCELIPPSLTLASGRLVSVLKEDAK